MIPYALFGAIIDIDGRPLELSAYDMSVEGFTFRLTETRFRQMIPHTEVGTASESKLQVEAMYLRFSVPGLPVWEKTISRDAFTLTVEDAGDAFDTLQTEPDSGETMIRSLRAAITDPEYAREVNRFMGAYRKYVEGKLAGDDAALAKSMTGYPAELEDKISDTFLAQRKKWLQPLREKMTEERREAWREVLHGMELVPVLELPEQWEELLVSPIEDVVRGLFQGAGLTGHPLETALLERLEENASLSGRSGGGAVTIAIGGARCPELTPKPEILFSLIDRIYEIGAKPLIQLPPIPERRWQETEDALCRLSEWVAGRISNDGRSREAFGGHGGSVEIAVGDWGTLMTVHNLPGLTPIPGSRMVKQRRDPRMRWAFPLSPSETGDDKTIMAAVNERRTDALGDHPGLPEGYPELLRDVYGVCGLIWSHPDYRADIHRAVEVLPDTLLQLPWTETNAGGHCTLRAAVETGERGRQMPEGPCSMCCRKKEFLYPDFLKLTGRYNGLYQLSDRILWDETIIESYKQQGVRRILLDLMPRMGGAV